MTDKHVWVTLADGKRLYVGKVPESVRPTAQGAIAAVEEAKAQMKRKRRQNPPPAPVEFPHAD